MEKVMGNNTYAQALSRGWMDKSAEENIGRQLLQELNEESEEDAVEQGVTQQDLPEKAKMKKAWGPIQATRMSSRIARDGKTIIEKAQDLKKAKKPGGTCRYE
jgi:uncharacterized membrane protein YvbJ